MGQKRSYKQCPKEFKEEAVTLLYLHDSPVHEAAKSLGIGANMFYRWKEQDEQKLEGKAIAEN